MPAFVRSEQIFPKIELIAPFVTFSVENLRRLISFCHIQNWTLGQRFIRRSK
jgi:hypothetical protein